MKTGKTLSAHLLHPFEKVFLKAPESPAVVKDGGVTYMSFFVAIGENDGVGDGEEFAFAPEFDGVPRLVVDNFILDGDGSRADRAGDLKASS